MITYTEKGPGLHNAIRAAGHWLEQRDGVWVSSDDAAVQIIIDGYTLDQTKAEIVPFIKDHARQIILARVPEWKQANLNARVAELLDIRMSAGLSPAEQAEMDALKTVWGWVKSVRDTSNTHESSLMATTSFSAALAYDWRIGWPSV